MKTIQQALMDEIHYPISEGFVENVMIKRGLEGEFTYEVAQSSQYMGAVADCLWSLLHAINFSEADKSFGSISDKDKERILLMVNSIYTAIGEPEVHLQARPMVFIEN
ncbi:MAG: hypothetical protein IIW42_07860 [Bacteroidaceae bacterium]|nr:hypothetical protein [Bacteroidaceae bacterium]